MEKVQLKDKTFRLSIPHKDILEAISKVANDLNRNYAGKSPLFIIVLNGAFMFASDLLKLIEVECQISFVKLASYEGTTTTGNVKSIIGLDENIHERDVVVIEDIVDTGITIETLYKQLSIFEPANIEICTLFFKPEAYKKDISINYIALEVPSDFVVGYGLDYDGLGRNLKDIYSLEV